MGPGQLNLEFDKERKMLDPSQYGWQSWQVQVSWKKSYQELLQLQMQTKYLENPDIKQYTGQLVRILFWLSSERQIPR